MFGRLGRLAQNLNLFPAALQRQAAGFSLCQLHMPPHLLLQFGHHIGLIQIFKEFLVSLPELRFFLQRNHAPSIVPGIVAVCEPASVKEIQEHFPVLGLHEISLPPLLQIPVHVLAVNAHHTRRISGAFHPALYL